MQAYEFYATTENGFIRIPNEYRRKLNNRIKVIIVNDEHVDSDLDSLFTPIIDTREWKFNREEANER